MKLVPTDIRDVVIVEPAVFGDDRGWFMESFNEARFHAGLKELGLPVPRASPCTVGSRISTPSTSVGIAFISTPSR